MSNSVLAGRRILVVGASSGIGEVIGKTLCGHGARTAFAARRMERLEAAVADSSGEALAVACDVTEPSSIERAMARTIEAFGGLDGLVYSTGAVPAGDIAETTFEDWRHVLDTNVIGAAMTTQAALPHLKQSHGCAIYLSSIAALDNPPRPGQSLYITSKAALNAQIACWQTEYRDVRFTRVSVGDTFPTEAGTNWKPGTHERYMPVWVDQDFMFGRVMDASNVAAQVVSVLASPEWIQELTIKPHYPYE